jgi:hypothetical protein
MLPNLGLWMFLATVVASASSHGAELTSGIAADNLDRIFVGTPTQLTLPPDFPSATARSTRVPCDSDVDVSRDNKNAANETPRSGAVCSADSTGTAVQTRSVEAVGPDDTRETTAPVVSSTRADP